MARVHPFIQQIDGLALARAVHAADQDDDREAPVLEQVVLRIEQGFAQLRYLARISLLADRVPQFRRFKHSILSFQIGNLTTNGNSLKEIG